MGVSIVISLIGRGEVGFKGGKLPGPAEGMKALREGDRAAAGEKESIKEKRAEQLSPGAEGSTKARKGIEEEEDDAGDKTKNDEDNGVDDRGEKNEDQGDKEKDQQDEPSKQDEKTDQEGAQKGKK